MISAIPQLSPELTDQLVVFRVRTDPEPKYAIPRFDGNSAVMDAYACGVKPADLLEVKRRMPRIALEPLEAAIRKALN